MSIFSNILKESYDFDYMMESIELDSIYVNESFTDSIKKAWNKIKELWNKFKKWVKEKVNAIRNKIRKIMGKVKKNKDNDNKNDLDMYYTCDIDTVQLSTAFSDFYEAFYNLNDNIGPDGNDYSIFKNPECKNMLDKLKSTANELINNLNKINVKKIKNNQDTGTDKSILNVFNILNNEENTLFEDFKDMESEIKNMDYLTKQLENSGQYDPETIKNIIESVKSMMIPVMNVTKVYYAKFTIIENALEFNIDKGLYPGFNYSKKSDEDLDDF